MIRASVVVPTRNRADWLRRCLDGLERQTLDRHEFEVIVADNGSTDGTRALVEQMLDECDHLRYVYVGAVGPSPARNAGLAVARADIIAFTDDDAVADPDWLAALLDGHRRWPDAGALSGRTELRFRSRAPSWFSDDLATWYSARDLGPSPRLLEHECPWGVNASVRADVARAIGGFDHTLGPGPRAWLVNEDLDFFERVRAAGHDIGYVPDALVLHDVVPQRLSRWWLLRRTFVQGCSDAVLDARTGAATAVPRREHVRRAARATFRGWRSLARDLRVADRPDRVWLANLLRRSQELGHAYASVGIGRYERQVSGVR
jgi:GT2 family glycosyltransferase